MPTRADIIYMPFDGVAPLSRAWLRAAACFCCSQHLPRCRSIFSIRFNDVRSIFKHRHARRFRRHLRNDYASTDDRATDADATRRSVRQTSVQSWAWPHKLSSEHISHMAAGNYTAKDITVLEGPEPVRKRPGMYIGGVGSAGLHHLVWETLDNSIDEAMNGFASNIWVTLHADGSAITIEDDGRGIPIDKHPTTKKSALEVIFTVLHAG